MTVCAQTSEADPSTSAPKDRLYGTVVNLLTGEPIVRALVESSDNRLATMTDGEGRFELLLPKEKSAGKNMGDTVTLAPTESGRVWSLQARKPGFLNQPAHRAYVAATPSRETTISLMPEGLILGRILSPDAEAIAGVNVQLFERQVQDGMPHWVPKTTVAARSNGEFRFADLAAGTYKLGTHEAMDNDPAVTSPGGQRYGFPPAYFPGVADFASAGEIHVAAGQAVQADLPLTRQPYYSVTIPLANFEPGSGINISVSVQGHKGPGYTLGFNGQKQSIEGLLPNGNYLVEVMTTGSNTTSGSMQLSVASAPAEAPAMTFTPAGVVTFHVAEQFTGESNLSFTWFSNGRSFSMHGPRLYLNARLEALADFEQQANSSLRPPAGPGDDALVIEKVMPGRYWLRLQTSRGYISAATMGGVDLLHEPLVISAGSNPQIEVTMRDDFAEVEGTVGGLADRSTAESQSALQTMVYFTPTPDGPGRLEQVSVAGDGKFESDAIPPGAYRVLAFKGPRFDLPYRDPEAMRAYEGKGPVVHLSGGQKTTVQLQNILESEE